MNYMQFKGWKPKKSPRIVRFYLNGEPGVFISRKKNLIQITSDDEGRAQALHSELKTLNVDLDTITTLFDLELKLIAADLLIKEPKKDPTGINTSPPVPFGQNHCHYSYWYLKSNQRSIDMKSISLKDRTKQNTTIVIDHLEPIEFKELLESVGFNVKYEALDLGSIKIQNSLDPTKVVLIKRKLISQGLLNKNQPTEHAHAQAKILHNKKLQYAKKGIHLQVIWIFESDTLNSKPQHLFNMLPTLTETTNFIQFLTTSCNQQVIESLGVNHTSYYLAKISQGLCEQELYYPVNVSSEHTFSPTNKNLCVVESFSEDQKHHAVVQAKDDLATFLYQMPFINKNIAKELAYTGKSLAQITSLTKLELEEIDGIGPKSAEVIYRMFNLCS